MSELRNQQSAYSYPSPAQTITKADITLREILDTYREDNDLLKLILATKTEEDKRRAEEEKCKTEKFKLQCKQVELELLKEQKKPPTIFTGAPSINNASSTANFNVKSPSDMNSPYLSIQPPLDSHFSNTTPTSATTHFSPPPSANNHNSNHVHDHMSYGSTTNSQSHSYHHHNNSNNNNNNSSTSSTSQKPSLTLSIPSFPIISSSPTVMHSHHSFSNPNSSVEHPHSASSVTHRHSFYSQSPTSAVGSKRTRPSENEVDHEYVMEAIRAKVQRNQEHPAKKFMNVLKPRSASMPVPPINNNSPTTSSSNHQHINRELHNNHNQNHHLNHHNHNGNNNNNNNNISNSNSNHHKRQQSSPPSPTPPLPISLPPTPQHHHQRSHHSTQQNPQTSSPVDPSQSHSPIPPPQLPPINVHSPGLNQDSKA